MRKGKETVSSPCVADQTQFRSNTRVKQSSHNHEITITWPRNQWSRGSAVGVTIARITKTTRGVPLMSARRASAFSRRLALLGLQAFFPFLFFFSNSGHQGPRVSSGDKAKRISSAI